MAISSATDRTSRPWELRILRIAAWLSAITLLLACGIGGLAKKYPVAGFALVALFLVCVALWIVFLGMIRYRVYQARLAGERMSVGYYLSQDFRYVFRVPIKKGGKLELKIEQFEKPTKHNNN